MKLDKKELEKSNSNIIRTLCSNHIFDNLPRDIDQIGSWVQALRAYTREKVKGENRSIRGI
jgi:hypothetical protein